MWVEGLEVAILTKIALVALHFALHQEFAKLQITGPLQVKNWITNLFKILTETIS